jgi:hypothetical protein
LAGWLAGPLIGSIDWLAVAAAVAAVAGAVGDRCCGRRQGGSRGNVFDTRKRIEEQNQKNNTVTMKQDSNPQWRNEVWMFACVRVRARGVRERVVCE